MGRKSLSLVVPCVFAAAVLTGSNAMAADPNQMFDQYWDEGVRFAKDQPMAFLVLACVFLVFGLIAKVRGASTFVTFGFFFLTVASMGVFIVMELTGQFMDRGVSHPPISDRDVEYHPTPRTAVPPPPTAAATDGAGPIGSECKHNQDCIQGTVCAHVAGARHCWPPCGQDGSCSPGFACFAAGSGVKVCVK